MNRSGTHGTRSRMEQRGRLVTPRRNNFFNGKKKDFSQPPAHEVKQGTGVLLMAELKFGKKSGAKANNFFVESVTSRKAIGSPPVKLELRCLNCVDENGTTLSPQVIDEDAIAITGPDQADFDTLTQFGPIKRDFLSAK